MKKHTKKLLVSILACALCFALTGCKNLDYRKAVRLHNAGGYAEAAEIFSTIADYKDSAQLATHCQYWAAVQLAEQGDYAKALPRFEKLGDNRDAAQWATECRYQLAISAFEHGDFPSAREAFLEIPDYRQSREYIRKIAWEDFCAAVTSSGSSLSTQYEGRTITVTAVTGDAPQIQFSLFQERDLEYSFRDSLCLTLTRDSLDAAFTAEDSFRMDFNGTQIGSQQTGTGSLHIPTCTPDTLLKMDTFTKTVTDNQGQTSTGDTPDDAVTAVVQENYRILMTVVPQLLQEAGIPLTLTDIGFAGLAQS